MAGTVAEKCGGAMKKGAELEFAESNAQIFFWQPHGIFC